VTIFPSYSFILWTTNSIFKMFNLIQEEVIQEVRPSLSLSPSPSPHSLPPTQIEPDWMKPVRPTSSHH